MEKNSCVKCGAKLILGGFAYNQDTCWDCFNEEVKIILGRIDQYPSWLWNKREAHKDILYWMMAVVFEAYGRKML